MTRAKDAPDWATGGHAEQTLWVYTDDTTPTTASAKVVEAGVARGWKLTNQHVYYTARFVRNDGGGWVYQELKLGDAAAGETRTYAMGYGLGGNYYWVNIGNNSTSWSGHNPNTRWVEAGIESTCHESRVNNYRVTAMQIRRKDNQFWVDVNNGVLQQDDPVVVKWCNKPKSARMALNSTIALQC